MGKLNIRNITLKEESNMNNKLTVEGTIIKVYKLWWIKINKKILRTSTLDGTTFPHLIKIKYNINNNSYIKNKLVYWPNDKINIEDKVIITYNKNKPSKVTKITKS